jgi:hypothetical protein|tara:strand:+ start:48 stop:674 length:627 start_codon:yes stop_codon:yes gene_type:complete
MLEYDDLLASLKHTLLKQTSSEVESPTSIVLDIELPKYDLGVDKDTMRGNLELFADRTALAESSRDFKAESGLKGQAKGGYQWLTEVPDGKGQASFRTALNRLEGYYTRKNKKVPAWLEEAKEHNDPTILNKKQQTDLFYADIFQRKGTTKGSGEGYEQGKLQQIMIDGNPNIMKDVYLQHWHTRPKDMSPESWDRVVANANRSYYEE